MHELVAMDLGGSAAFVDALVRTWEAGDAAMPIDQRLPASARHRLAKEMRAGAVVDSSGSRTVLDGGLAVEGGDALVMVTSGTTGSPKGAVLTHEAVAASATATSSRLGVDPSADRWLACLPLAHVGGLSVVTRALLTGTPVEVHPSFDPDVVGRAPHETGATLVSLVPVALERLRADAAARFRRIVLGGQAPPGGLGANVSVTYGMTETGSGVVYDGVALDGVEVAIKDGQILLRCPMLLRTYRDGTDPRVEGGYYPTGDAGRIGPDGRLEVFGRLDDAVVSGGEKVWPAGLEVVLGRHRHVASVAVGGRPDATWGERVVAYVVAEPGSVPTAPAQARTLLSELRDLVKSEYQAYAAPRGLVIVPELPLTAIGKVRRSALGALSEWPEVIW